MRHSSKEIRTSNRPCRDETRKHRPGGSNSADGCLGWLRLTVLVQLMSLNSKPPRRAGRGPVDLDLEHALAVALEFIHGHLALLAKYRGSRQDEKRGAPNHRNRLTRVST